MNILLTSAGRRSYLVKYFKEAIEPLAGKLHVSNSTELCSSFKFADHTLVSPQIYDKEYIQVILSYCRKHKITLVIPLFDIDLLVLSRNKRVFLKNGITVLVSNAQIIELCNDKWLTYNFLTKNGFDTPKSYIEISLLKSDLDRNLIHYPLILKPRWGMGSIGVYRADNMEELLFFNKYIQKQINECYLKYESSLTPDNRVIFQKMIAGEEYGLDIINDLNTNYSGTFVKRKIAMRSGETDISELITNHRELEEIGKAISAKLKHIGNLDVDILVEDNKFKVLEFNARFGGGYPFTHAAGVNLPKAIIDWLQKNQTDHLKIKTANRIQFKSIEII
ncbi:ATP-grasp domain-containing protein [Dokdonia sinensis]|uniref:ATP-grasp domain-containing protein n=1 Tax=Dokdonia sinensis TaxID=2479847 RepID=A0A3M0GJF8_9FLAO|nr:ATP-grasp domain-containing protein [Dokdonia sinensis]RMB57436.1 ATP-grasp domain-containing protein [Dokdonia sinensis]